MLSDISDPCKDTAQRQRVDNVGRGVAGRVQTLSPDGSGPGLALDPSLGPRFPSVSGGSVPP